MAATARATATYQKKTESTSFEKQYHRSALYQCGNPIQALLLHILQSLTCNKACQLNFEKTKYVRVFFLKETSHNTFYHT